MKFINLLLTHHFNAAAGLQLPTNTIAFPCLDKSKLSPLSKRVHHFVATMSNSTQPSGGERGVPKQLSSRLMTMKVPPLLPDFIAPISCQPTVHATCRRLVPLRFRSKPVISICLLPTFQQAPQDLARGLLRSNPRWSFHRDTHARLPRRAGLPRAQRQ